MKITPWFIIIVFFLSSCILHSQEYFQQDVDYTIEVRLDDQNHILRGFEKIRYTNNAPEALTELYFHLYPNAYKNNQTALAEEQFKNEGKHYLFDIYSQQGFIDSLDFKVEKSSVKWNYLPEHIDICRIKLNKPLKPGETITITTPFRVKIPLAVTSRLGYVEQSYKISQWFPKPAVYNNKGWHKHPYRDRGKSYSEYGSFDVSITLPENYYIAAPGKLMTKSERKRINRREKKTRQKLGFNSEDMEIPNSSGQTKTVRYEIDSVTDFAWFADKRFYVLTEEVRLPGKQKKVTIRSFFTNDQASGWLEANDYLEEAIKTYSQWYGSYPYNNFTAVSGVPGSESNDEAYPAVACTGFAETNKQLEQLLVQGLAHTWFSGKVNFNPQKYPFLVEGLTTYSEIRYFSEKYGDDNKLYKDYNISENIARIIGIEKMDFKDELDQLYYFKARQNKDQPTNTPLSELSRINYYSVAKAKTAKSFLHLTGYLNPNRFDLAMRNFFNTWKYKHPGLENLEQAFKWRNNKELSWFFDKMLKTDEKSDYSIVRYRKSKVLVKNKASIAAPLVLSGFNKDKAKFTKWYEGFRGKKWLSIPGGEYDKVVIDPERIMLEFYRNNNTLKTKGLLKRGEPFDLQFAGLFSNPDYTRLNYLPALGWNSYDKIMLGLSTYDPPLPTDRFDYFFAPFYTTGTNNLAGKGYVAYNMFPDNLFQKIQLKTSGKRFGYSDYYKESYNKFKAELTLSFKHSYPDHNGRNKLHFSYTYATDLIDILEKIHGAEGKSLTYNTFLNAAFIHDYSDKSINPYRFRMDVEWSPEFLKSSFEASYKYSYYMKEGLSLRLFGGMFFDKSIGLPWNYAFHLGGGNGWQDYKYEHTFLGRFEGPRDENANQAFVQQYFPEEGGFSIYSPLGNTKDWLLSLNVKSAVPVFDALPIHVYGNIGAFGKNQPITEKDISNKDWAYETGVKFSFLNMVDIYFPVMSSKNLTKASQIVTSRYGERIRFHVKFDMLNTERLKREVKSLF